MKNGEVLAQRETGGSEEKENSYKNSGTPISRKKISEIPRLKPNSFSSASSRKRPRVYPVYIHFDQAININDACPNVLL